MYIAFACDHAATELKYALIDHARALGHTVDDCGVERGGKGDYPLLGAEAARKVASGDCDCGVVLCGTGVGISIACNKVPGIRCALLSDCYSARMSRAHNDANMAAFGARVTGDELAKEMLSIFLATPFEGGRHARRVEQIGEIERGG